MITTSMNTATTEVTAWGENDDELLAAEQDTWPLTACVTPGEVSTCGLRNDQSFAGWHKGYWSRVPHHGGVGRSCRAYLIKLEAPSEQIGEPSDVLVSVSNWPQMWSAPAPEATGLRGVIALGHRRQTIFVKQLACRISALPRWVPHARFARQIPDA